MRFALVVIMSLCACARAKPDVTSATANGASEAPPCPVTPADAKEPWRQVNGDGFSFCVPTSWRAVGAREWRSTDKSSGSAAVSWSVGMSAVKVPFRVGRITAGSLPTAGPMESTDPTTFTEIIGGRSVKLIDVKQAGRYLSSAAWTDPDIRFAGDATRSLMIDVLFSIYRTVRLAP
jgi:hypothetical protein